MAVEVGREAYRSVIVSFRVWSSLRRDFGDGGVVVIPSGQELEICLISGEDEGWFWIGEFGFVVR